MDIESNFNQNLKSSVKKNSSKLPASNKFLLHSLLKNLDEVEDLLDDDSLVEYKVGNIKNAIKETNLHQNSTNYKMYNGVEKPYNFKSQGSSPTYGGTGYNFESQGPLGVSYYEQEEEEEGEEILETKKQETREATTTSSSGAYSTPKFWAKEWKKHNTKKKKSSKRKSSKRKSSKRKSSHNNKRWMPGAQFVKVKDKCKTFPYCNQGDITALELWEKKIMSEAAKNVSKKTGVSEKGVRKMVEKELGEIIRRAFYKSPITDLVGTGNMDTPTGKIFTMNSNSGSKHES